ncbi:E2-like conjugating enzyme [Lachancea thermotolerans CBS 6340]|uniref:KLTH0E05720p n=1 Tax=Lachancea thermotolerans (strain ATCC 56472 / CBS 6340 / NRRL Y-8284) TaxID=559295 RepID=C5DHN2_LACTC|nr:KLTH0E05720p [Lachancea thermotolerans CBS 6340]CAR23293.1 KLTH0E05720p [Lachancea thermotolerans CBS 6340]
MIPLGEFREQLQALIPVLQLWPKCLSVHASLNGEALIGLAEHPTLAFYTYEFEIGYSQTYQEPRLIFKIWEATTEQGAELQRPCFPADLSRLMNVQDFSIGLDHLHEARKDSWFSVHACDTSHIVGSVKHHYLKRWASVYLSLFDPCFSNTYLFVDDV